MYGMFLTLIYYHIIYVGGVETPSHADALGTRNSFRPCHDSMLDWRTEEQKDRVQY